MASNVERALTTYRKRGLRGLVSSAKMKVKGETGEVAYQEKVAYGLAERCAQIDRALPAGSRSALDIGCNLGDITAHCASRGLWAIGVDQSKDVIDGARRRHSGKADTLASSLSTKGRSRPGRCCGSLISPRLPLVRILERRMAASAPSATSGYATSRNGSHGSADRAGNRNSFLQT